MWVLYECTRSIRGSLLRTPLRIWLPALALLSLALPGPARADGEVTFTKVLDSETPVPGGGTIGPFDALEDDDESIAMDPDGNVVFSARGVFAVIEDELHLVPHPEGDLGHIAIDGSRVGLGVLDLGGRRVGAILRWEPGTEPIEISGAHTLVPGGDGCVFWTRENGVSYWRFWMEGDAIAFFGVGSDDGGGDCDRLRGKFLWWDGSIEHLAGVAGRSSRANRRSG